jgi:hypothetical protein
VGRVNRRDKKDKAVGFLINRVFNPLPASLPALRRAAPARKACAQQI